MGWVSTRQRYPYNIAFTAPEQYAGEIPPEPTSSAGVFDSDGNLMRTLWSAVPDHPNINNPVAAWDGLLDDLSVAPTATYTLKVIRNACTYTWDGVVGNTSTFSHAERIDYLGGAVPINDMCITDAGEMYYTTVYDERYNVGHVTTTANPHVPKYVLGIRNPRRDQHRCCTDGINVYWSWHGGATFDVVFGTTCSDDGSNLPNPGVKQATEFDFGSPFEAVNLIAENDSGVGQFILDMAVQKTGDYLFVSRIEVPATPSYSIWTVDKTTGETLQHNASLGYVLQGSLAIDPVTDAVWVLHSTDSVHRNKISKLTADGSGVLTETGIHITTGLTNGLSMEVSPDGSMLLICDGDTQQVLAFNTSDGSVKTAWGTSGKLGQAGGYASNGPAVTNDKFMFASDFGFSSSGGCLAFQADGSFWIGDGGNCRSLHFSSGNSPTYIDQIAFLPAFYACYVCRDDETRVMANWLEFEIDYNQPLASGWALKNNWRDLTKVPLGTFSFDDFTFGQFFGTYSNGKTYAVMRLDSDNKKHVYELTSSGVRDTGAIITGFRAHIDRDFNIWMIYNDNPAPQAGQSGQFLKNPFTGFDGSDNPTWTYPTNTSPPIPASVVFTTQILPAECGAVYWKGGADDMAGPLSNGVLPFRDPDPGHETYHLAGIEYGTGDVKFLTHHLNPSNHGGTNSWLRYPEAPYFAGDGIPPNDVGTGSGVNNAAGPIFWKPGAADFFTGYRGESWGSNQTNVWSHWHESGLLINRWGPVAPYFPSVGDMAFPRITSAFDGDIEFLFPNARNTWMGMVGMAGNVDLGGLAYQNGKYYIYHNDEWYHSGIHRWEVGGLDTIEIETHTTSWDSSTYVAPTPDPANLLDGLPYNTYNVANGTAGWVRNPTSNITIGTETDWCNFRTNSVLCNPHNPPDIVFEAAGLNVTRYVSKALPRTGSGNWGIDATIFLSNWSDPYSNPLDPSLAIFYDILDSSDRIILRMHHGTLNASSPDPSNTTRSFYANYLPAFLNQTSFANYALALRPLTVSANVGTGLMTATWGIYSRTGVGVFEGAADITAPAKFRIMYETRNSPPIGGRGVCFTKLNYTQS